MESFAFPIQQSSEVLRSFQNTLTTQLALICKGVGGCWKSSLYKAKLGRFLIRDLKCVFIARQPLFLNEWIPRILHVPQLPVRSVMRVLMGYRRTSREGNKWAIVCSLKSPFSNFHFEISVSKLKDEKSVSFKTLEREVFSSVILHFGGQ